MSTMPEANREPRTSNCQLVFPALLFGRTSKLRKGLDIGFLCPETGLPFSWLRPTPLPADYERNSQSYFRLAQARNSSRELLASAFAGRVVSEAEGEWSGRERNRLRRRLPCWRARNKFSGRFSSSRDATCSCGRS